MVLPFQSMSPPEDAVAPVSRFSAVLAASVGVPFTSAQAAMGNVNARMATVVVFSRVFNVLLRLCFVFRVQVLTSWPNHGLYLHPPKLEPLLSFLVRS